MVEVLERHERFDTARLEIAGTRVDLARTRRESYPEPGALPVVEPAPIGADLARRDFTVNALAVGLDGRGGLIDPHNGLADLGSRSLRVIHPGSFADDPTRALRAARYCARLGFSLEPETERLLRSCRIATVSADRVEGELLRIASEPAGLEALGLLAQWGLLELDPERAALLGELWRLLAGDPWRSSVPRAAAVVTFLGLGEPELERLRVEAGAVPAQASEAVERAGALSELELAILAALGAGWVGTALAGRAQRGELGGEDLLAAGVASGPAVGIGLAAARRALIDGEIEPGRETELAVALAAIRATG